MLMCSCGFEGNLNATVLNGMQKIVCDSRETFKFDEILLKASVPDDNCYPELMSCVDNAYVDESRFRELQGLALNYEQ